METHYHSQFDNDEYYNADVFRFHHELYGLLVMAFDRVKVAPVNVGRTLQALQESVRPVTGREDEKSLRFCWSGRLRRRRSRMRCTEGKRN